MKNKFTITITNVYGSKHYTVAQVVKLIALFIALVLIGVIIFGIVSFAMLKKELITVEGKEELVLQKIQKIQDTNKQIKVKNEKLKEQREVLKYNVINEQKKLFNIEQKIKNVENIIGAPDYNDWENKNKIDNITITNLQKYLLAKEIPLGYPIKYTRITASYGWRNHPIRKQKEFHKGIDLKQKKGYPIKATADGIVSYANFQSKKGFGNLVKITHHFSFVSVYGHLNSINVKYGKFVKKGDIIGYVGSTGLSTGSHLHYEIRFLNKTLDPIDLIKVKTNNFQKIFKNNRSIPWQEIVKSLTNKKN